MNGYIAFYQGKRLEIHAASLYTAKLEAIKLLKVPKSKQGLLAVELAETPAGPVIHSTAEIG
jgi:hypothetical protein